LQDIDKLVQEFVKAEDHNLSLMQYVNDLTGEINTLEEDIKGLREDIDKYRGHGVNNENNREKILKKLNEELKQTEEETAEYEKEYVDTMKTLNALKVGIQSIFERVGCKEDQH